MFELSIQIKIEEQSFDLQSTQTFFGIIIRIKISWIGLGKPHGSKVQKNKQIKIDTVF